MSSTAMCQIQLLCTFSGGRVPFGSVSCPSHLSLPSEFAFSVLNILSIRNGWTFDASHESCSCIDSSPFPYPPVVGAAGRLGRQGLEDVLLFLGSGNRIVGPRLGKLYR